MDLDLEGAYRDVTPGLRARIARLAPQRAEQVLAWSAARLIAGVRVARTLAGLVASVAFVAIGAPVPGVTLTSTSASDSVAAAYTSAAMLIAAVAALALWLGLRLAADQVARWR